MPSEYLPSELQSNNGYPLTAKAETTADVFPAAVYELHASEVWQGQPSKPMLGLNLLNIRVCAKTR
jgi:hypothetical protein